MPSTYSTNLKLELIATGEQSGTWGTITNTNLGTLLEQAVSGYVTQAVATGTDTTITIPDGSTGVARNMYLELTGTGGTNTNLIVPTNKKLYFIFNNTSSGQVTVKVAGQTGVSVPNGKKMILVSNGTDIVNAANYIASLSSDNLSLSGTLSVTGATTLSNTLGVTGLITATGGVSGALNGTVGATTPASGAFTTLSASSTATLSGLTASTALALDGSKNIVSVTNTGTGSNVLATNPVLVTPNLGTPSAINLSNATNLSLTTGVTGILPVANGGTNSSTASGARTNLGATTVGDNLFTLANPSAIRFIQINADNTVTAQDAATFRTAIGAGVGSVTSVATGTGLSGGPITSTGTISLANTTVTAAAYGSATQVGTFTVDAQGRLTAASNVTVTPAFASITSTPTTLSGYGITDAVPNTRTITAGTGLSGGGDLSANRTLSLANTAVSPASYGSASQVATFTVDAQGRLTAASNTAIAIANTAVSGLGTMSTQNSTSVSISGGSITGITDLALADGGTGASTASGARTNLGATTVGGNFFTLTNPSAITFIRVNADNSVSTLDAATFRTAIGVGTGTGTVLSVDVSGGTTGLTTSGGPVTTTGTITLAGTLALANGGTGATTAPNARTNLGATTVGGNFFTLTNPSAITFIRVNADNTVSTLDAASFRTAIGVGTGVGTVTSIDVSGGTTGLTTSGGPVTSSGTITLAGTLALANGGTGATTQSGARTNLGLGTIATQNSSSVTITGGSITGITDIAIADGGTGASNAPNARTNLGATTTGSNLFTITDPSAITFIRINADNSVSALSAANFRTAIGASTVGGNLFTLSNPSAVRFIQINADNTVTAQDAATFRSAIGAGVGDGTVTSVTGTGTVNGITLTGTVTGSGNLTLGGTLSNISLTTQVTGTLPVGNGGTGATTLTGIIKGNGTSAFTAATAGTDYAKPDTASTWTAAQTFRAANAIRSEASSTQDAIVIAGRAGGTNSYAATITPATLSANRTVTIPDETFTVGYRNIPAVGTKTGSYTLAVGDVGKYVQVGTGGSITIPDATFSEGDIVSVFNNTTGNITITCTITTAYIAGTDSDKASVTLATRGVASILFISGTVCVISGNVS